MMTLPPKMSTHAILRLIAFASMGLGIAGFASAQTNQGVWRAPFNHAVPAAWIDAQNNNRDGEPKSPYLGTNDPPQRFLAGHMCLIPTGTQRGKVLVWNWMRRNTGAPTLCWSNQFSAPTAVQYWAIVDPEASPATFQNFELSLPADAGDLFCAGHAWTKHGHLLVCGGNRYSGGSVLANKLAYRFDPMQSVGNGMWFREPDMLIERWYPTVTAMSTDSGNNNLDLLLASGGSDTTLNLAYCTYEAFDPTNAPTLGIWQTNPRAPFAGLKVFPGPPDPPVQCPWQFWNYPRDIILSSGWKFSGGMGDKSYRLKHDNVTSVAPSWEEMPLAAQPYEREYGSVVLFPNLGGQSGGLQDVVLRIGGHVRTRNFTSCGYTTPDYGATAVTEYCFAGKLSSDSLWKWQLASSMAHARSHPNTVLLPDGTILVTHGKQNPVPGIPGECQTDFPVLQAEVFNDTPWQWRTLASSTVRRGYHGTAILLPSGRVLVGGGEQREKDYELFDPPYLSNGTARPTILAAPTNITYDSTISITYQAGLPMGVYVEKAVLMAPAAMTHHSDMHARYVELDVNQDVLPPDPPPPNPAIYVKTPSSSKRAPRGYYMLFLVTNPQGVPKGTPSVATWVNLQ